MSWDRKVVAPWKVKINIFRSPRNHCTNNIIGPRSFISSQSSVIIIINIAIIKKKLRGNAKLHCSCHWDKHKYAKCAWRLITNDKTRSLKSSRKLVSNLLIGGCQIYFVSGTRERRPGRARGESAWDQGPLSRPRLRCRKKLRYHRSTLHISV